MATYYVLTTKGGDLGSYESQSQAAKVAQSYNKKGNRPGSAYVTTTPPGTKGKGASSQISSPGGSYSPSPKKYPWGSSSLGSGGGGSAPKHTPGGGFYDPAQDDQGWKPQKTTTSGGWSPGGGGGSGGKYKYTHDQEEHTPLPKTQSAGGVLIDPMGLVLVREVANHFGGAVWTLAKGGVDAGETLEEAALREVLEETGWTAHILQQIPGSFEGSTTINTYFLMRPGYNTGAWQYAGTPKQETWRIAWVPIEAAKGLSGMSSSSVSKRDIAVLDAAWKIWLNSEEGQAWKNARVKYSPNPGYPMDDYGSPGTYRDNPWGSPFDLDFER